MTVLVAVGKKTHARAVVETAYSLADAYDDTLVALHVLPEDDIDGHRDHIMGLPYYGNFTFSRNEEGAEQFARRVVESALHEDDAQEVETHGRVGVVDDEILAMADDLLPRYLVIGGRRRSPVGKAAFGDLTQQLLLRSKYPVVTLMGS